MEIPPRKFFRLAPGREVRLRYAYYITCTGYETDEATGEVDSGALHLRPRDARRRRSGRPPQGGHAALGLRRARGRRRGPALRPLFKVENPRGVLEHLNPDSLEVLRGGKLEPALAEVESGQTVQFERLGYFCADPTGTRAAPVFNRTVTLRDTWARIQKRPDGT